MAAPANQQELLSFLRSANYMGPFIQNLSSVSAPLRGLIKKDARYHWSGEHQEAFEAIKAAISEHTTLAYFDRTQPITLQVAALMKGLRTSLLEGGKPVAFASKALTAAEFNYANIERELLAVVYRCERFHDYIFSRPITVESDYKPLSDIHVKYLSATPSRLRRMLLRLQPYDVTIQYVPGKDMPTADALSRLLTEEHHLITDLDIEVHEVSAQFTTGLLLRIAQETAADHELCILMNIVFTGWPELRSEVPQLCLKYWNFRDKINIDNGILFKGPRIIQPTFLHQLHVSQPGTKKTRYLACLYKDIEEMT